MTISYVREKITNEYLWSVTKAVEDRCGGIAELLSDPGVVLMVQRFMELSREEANTRETVTATGE